MPVPPTARVFVVLCTFITEYCYRRQAAETYLTRVRSNVYLRGSLILTRENLAPWLDSSLRSVFVPSLCPSLPILFVFKCPLYFFNLLFATDHGS